MQEDDWTDEDRLFPLYCCRCRGRTPRQGLVASGMCASCHDAWVTSCQEAEEAAQAEKQAAEEAAQQKEADARKRAKEQARAIYETDTHKGICPQCGSRNIVERREEVGLKGAQGFFAVAVLGPLAMLKSRSEQRRRCIACGNEWHV